MTGRIHGKTAIVTGAGANLGRAVAMKFAAEGADVIVAEINADAAAETVELIKASGGAATTVIVDVGQEDSIRAMVAQAMEISGRIDILHNNAVLRNYPGRRDPILDLDPAEWMREFQVNIVGTALCGKYAIPHMIDGGGGSIINTSSVSAMAGDMNRPQYGAAKAAINNLTMSIACLYGNHGVRCNAIAPGNFPRSGAEMNPFGDLSSPMSLPDRHQLIRRRGLPEDVANLALFLASDEASFITGRLIPCDGGLTGVQNFDFTALRPLPGEDGVTVP